MSESTEITMVTVFTLNDDTVEVEEFEEDFLALGEMLRDEPGSQGNALGRSLRNPRTYTTIGTWDSVEDYKAAVSGGTFFVNLSALYHLAAISSDQTHTVARAGETTVIGGVTALTTFTLHEGTDAEAFEQAFLAHAEFMAVQDGFLSFQLQKSDRRERTYVNIGQWRDPGAYKAVVSKPEFHADVARIGAVADVTPDLVAPYAPAPVALRAAG